MSAMRSGRRRKSSSTLPRRLLHGLAVAGAVAAPAVQAADKVDDSATEVSFDRSMLPGAGQGTTDLSRFERGNMVLPGLYRLDVFLNGNWVGRGDVRFAAPTPEASAQPCMDATLLAQIGWADRKWPADIQARLADPKACVAIDELVPGASASFDQPNLRLDVSVPQALLGGHARGYVSPEHWDRGVNAALLNYDINDYRSHSGGVTQNALFASLNAGLNLGDWHLRHDSTFLRQTGAGPTRQHWQNVDTYVRRDLSSLRAQITLGDAYTGGDLFDSVSIRGAQLATDDRMLPDSLRGYAPVVRGVAETNARVTIRQNGIVLYETTVAPGPFSIGDLYPTGYGGDLDVTVTEADGRIRTFAVPYASVPQLLRPGISRFAVVAGELHDTAIHSHPAIAQGTLQRGFTNLWTGYVGAVALDGYAAVELGSAFNTRMGAWAVDLTEARTRIPGQGSDQGQSLRVSFSKILPATNTSLSIATYRYSTSGYLGLRDALTARDLARGYSQRLDPNLPGFTVPGSVLTPAQQAALQGASDNFRLYTNRLDRQRSRFDLSLSQPLGTRGGSLYVTGSAIDYWNRRGTDVQFQAGYNNHFGRLNYSLSVARTRSVFGQKSTQAFLSFTLPLGSGIHAPTLGGNYTHESDGHALAQATLNGTLGEDNALSYGVTASHDNGSGTGGGSDNAGSVYVGYRSPIAQFNASAGGGSGYSQASLAVSGTVVAHPGGVTFGLPAGDTIGLVQAEHGQGARVLNSPGTQVDRHGYALVPYLNPYQSNVVQLDPKGLPLDIGLDATSMQTAPHAGAVVMLKFPTSYGRTVILKLRRSDGAPLPFGADVLDEQDRPVGVIGQGGRALARINHPGGRLKVRWTSDSASPMQCGFAYRLTPVEHREARAIETLDTECVMETAPGKAL